MLLLVPLFLVMGVLVLPPVASADLPKKPACTDVTARLLKSIFRFSFSSHWSSREHRAGTSRHLRCVVSSADGDLEIDYDRYSSVAAARAHYGSSRRALIREGKHQPIDSINQILPLIPLRGLGDMAFRSTDATSVEFVDGTDRVTIKNGFALIEAEPSQAITRILAFAKYLDRHG